MQNKVSFKEINRLAIPAIFSGIIEPLISLTDTAMAGHLPTNSEEALAAIGLVGSFMSALTWIFIQTSSALSALVSHGVGENRLNRLKTLVSQVLFFNLFLSLLLSIGSFLFDELIFRLYGAKSSLLHICIEYFSIRVWGYPFTLITLAIFGIFRGLQNTTWAMIISLIGGFMNIGLDFLLVFLFNSGVKGIAYASLISQGIMFFLSLFYLFRKTPFRLTKLLPLNPLFGKNMKMSIDLFFRTLSLNFGFFVAYRFATLLGNDNNKFIAAHVILLQVWLFSSYLLDGYAHAGRAIAGKLFGAKDLNQLNNLVKKLIGIMFFIGISLMISYFLLENQIGKTLTKSENVLLVFYSTFWIVATMQPINSIAFMMDGIYKGLGETKVLRNIFLGAVLLCFIPFLFLFRYLDLGLKGIWYAFFIWMILRASSLMIHYYKKYYTFEAL